MKLDRNLPALVDNIIVTWRVKLKAFTSIQTTNKERDKKKIETDLH